MPKSLPRYMERRTKARAQKEYVKGKSADSCGSKSSGSGNKKKEGTKEWASEAENDAKDKLPEQENIDLHGMDAGAEHGSGWTLEGIDMKKTRAAFPGSEKGAVWKDGGQVNRAQQETINDMRIPVTDELAKHIPVDVAINSMPEYESKDPGEEEVRYQKNLELAGEKTLPQRILDEGQKMGLFITNDEAKYQETARTIRVSDSRLSAGILPSLAYAPMQIAKRADEVKPMIGNNPSGDILPRKIKLNPYVEMAIAYDPRFSPPEAPKISPEMQVPGGMNMFYTSRSDTLSGNQLEKLVVVNPKATQNLLDKATFTPALRNLTQIPAISRQYMLPRRY